MTFSTAVGDIENILLGVVLLRLNLVMAVIAGIAGVVGVVALRALPTCAAVVHVKFVPVDFDAAPVVGVMAL